MKSIATFLERTEHRIDNGGYEVWSIDIEGRKFIMHCDLRIPGLVDPWVQDLPKNREKVCVCTILYITTNTNAEEVYDSEQSSQEEQKCMASTIINVLLEKIKPYRDFKYLAFVYNVNNKYFYKNIFEQITTEVSNEIWQQVMLIIKTELQVLIESGQWELAVKKLK